MKEIQSTQHPLVKYWAKLARDAGFRNEEERVLLEGKNVIFDLAQKLPLKALIVTSLKLVPKDSKADEIYLVSEAIIEKISTVMHSEGIIAELEKPNLPLPNTLRRLLVLDRIQDPGNLGTLLRSAIAFGWEAIFLISGTVDPYNDKALRAAKGATFQLPLIFGNWDDLAKVVQKQDLQIIVADMDGKKPEEVLAKKMALVLGNEGQGVHLPNGMAHQKTSLPMQGEMESLNVAVAGSILMYLYQE